jgi:phosphatidylinositol phospholipase C delta
VHNGEAPDNKSNENLSPLPSPRSPSSKSEHKRHYSGSTLSSRAAAAFEKAEDKLDIMKKHFVEKTGFGKENASNEERGRKHATSTSLDVGKEIDRPSSLRSMRSGEPLVLHGWTLTAPIGFRAVCQTIRETAFLTSQLPLIISLEVHADPEQQEVMVEIMKEEWKGLLVEQPQEGCNPDERLPRLEELKNKILIKVKKATADKQEPVSTATTLVPVLSKTDAESTHSASDDERGAAAKKKVKICENLSKLGIYTHSEHFQSFEAKSAKKPPHIFSISESQIIELHETKKSEMMAHNRDFFMRAYPAGFRIDSSNLDPSVFWRKGVQMVALNWQKLDEGMMLNEGMFADEHGWVLKPSGYRSDASEPIDYKTIDLKITVLAGQHIPMPPGQKESSFHPYIRCELHVEREQEHTSEPIKSAHCKKETDPRKGDHPDFGADGCELKFPLVTKVVEELSFLR